MMSEAIVVQNLNKSFGRRAVLKDVSLRVPAGVVFALLGENGAGKSTLIRSLLGYHRFQKGSIEVLGLNPILQPLEIRRRVGYVADSPGLYEWMTLAQAGWYASGFYPPGYLAEYSKLLSEFELDPQARIRDLSKGMRAKTVLALAIAFDPDLLILDEPTSGLDPQVRRSFLEGMVDRAANGKTVFLSSHQIHEVERVADWVAILHSGVLRVSAPLEELKDRVTILKFSMRDTLLALPVALQELEVLHSSTNGRTTELFALGFHQRVLDELKLDSNLFDVQSIRPSLEDLYVAYTRSGTPNIERPPTRKIASDVA
ncbi:MAG: ABC transporter ATP-binding protein [Pirellula sp.]